MKPFSFPRIPLRVAFGGLAASMLCAAMLAGAGCALVPQKPLVQQPMTATPPAPPTNNSPGAIFNTGYAGHPLFEDQRPRNVGDILTIMIAENVNATKSSGLNTNRQSGMNLAASTPGGILPGLFNSMNAGANGTNSFQATGGATAGNTFSGTLTVTVTQVLPNGNLVVSGEKQMLINQGNEYVRFSGVVNPNTISGQNSVYSTEVADAKIEYSAKGVIDEAEHMGWFQRIVQNIAPW
jgi:flagellar L-ring protein FlgH